MKGQFRRGDVTALTYCSPIDVAVKLREVFPTRKVFG